MKTEKDDGLDDLFKKGLADPVNEPAFREADWDAMEQMLDKPKKRGIIVFWLPILGSVAALLLVFIGYLYLKPEVVKPTKTEQVAVNHPSNPIPVNPAKDVNSKKDTGTSGGPIRQAANSSKRKDIAANYANKPGTPQHGQKGNSFFTLSGKGRRNTTGPGTKNSAIATNNTAIAQTNTPKTAPSNIMTDQPVIANNTVTDRKNSGTSDDSKTSGTIITGKDSSVNANALASGGDHKNVGTADDHKNPTTTDDHKNLGTADAAAAQKGALADNTLPSSTATPSAKVKGLLKLGRTVFAVSILASSDLNGVNSSFQQSKVGGNFGAMFSATFNKRWTISTGAQYDIKPYLTNFNNYHTAYQFKQQPTSVYANCRMLEIPLDVNYKVYSAYGNRITLGTGLSSYFMLREDYKFNYTDYTSGPASYTVINKNRNILSVVNLDATYEHQINSKVGITLQPYLKVPLTNVGYSQVRLQSSGVALGLNWNLNASPKPK